MKNNNHNGVRTIGLEKHCIRIIALQTIAPRDNCPLAINEGVFPDSLKIANITLVHKKDEKTDKENYRPVSVLPLLSKVFERLLYDQLRDY